MPGRGTARTHAGIPFGGAVQAEHFDSDPSYRQAFLDHCDLVMPMNELKFSLLRPNRESWNFEPADRLVDFAIANGRLCRGTTHVWYGATPDWITRLESEREIAAALGEHVERVSDRYRGRVTDWDVCNEVIAHDPASEGPLRDTFWLRRLGPRHIPDAFALAARADPSATLTLNDYDLEFRGSRYDLRRATMLSIVRQMQDRNVPVHRVGLQAHLYLEKEIDVEGLARFGAELKALGVGLVVTELDLIDWQIEGGPAEQDAAAERSVSAFLDGLLDAGRPAAVVAWGITDRYSWISDVMPREDGKPERPLPLDRDYRPKPWYETLRRRLATA
ncbi:1,4-beta-xylanase [Aurantimonas sp. Leaf443]|nr:1,4-beta-xylanase [Aurantimonas sp. Leaf443]